MFLKVECMPAIVVLIFLELSLTFELNLQSSEIQCDLKITDLLDQNIK